jgi:hypothetical protein
MLIPSMDLDYTALASRVAARAEILGCVILSRDGLVLGAFPPNGEQDITPGLLRFAALGEPERGFIQFPDELWVYLRHGAYAVFAVAEADTRPGILLDYLEQALLVAVESRSQRSAASEPAAVDLNRRGVRPGRRLRAATGADDDFRSSLVAMEQASTVAPDVVPQEIGDEDLDWALAEAVQVEAGLDDGRDLFGFPMPDIPAPPLDFPGTDTPEWPEGSAPPEGPPAEDLEPSDHPEWHEPPPAPEGTEARPHGHRPEEIDRVALAREFASLLQEGPANVEEDQ